MVGLALIARTRSGTPVPEDIVLADDAAAVGTRLIRTIPRKGIRFVGVVQERAQPDEEAPAAPAVLDAGTPGRTATDHDKAASAERRQLTTAVRVALMRVVRADSDTMRPPQTGDKGLPRICWPGARLESIATEPGSKPI